MGARARRETEAGVVKLAEIKSSTLGDLRPPAKKAVRASSRRLMKTHTRLTVYRDNEDLRAKVSRGSRLRRLRKSSRDKVEKQEPKERGPPPSRALVKKGPLNYVGSSRRETGYFLYRGSGG